MTILKPQSGAPGATDPSPRREGPGADRPRGHPPAEDDPESDAEKIRREQATTPALMPIGDPAGAA